MAVSAIAAPIANSVSQKILGTQGNLTPFASTSPVLAKTVAGFASSTVTELTRVAIQGGKLNWVSIASSAVQAFTSAAIGSYQAKTNALNQPTYADNFDADRKIRAQMFGLGSNNAESNTPSVLRLSDDEVQNNAMARQEAEKGFNGLRASYVDSPQQINAKNGGANFSYGDALGNGVVYDDKQYMKGMPRTAGAGDVKGQVVKQNDENWGGKAFNDYANNAFTRGRLQLADAIFTKAADSVLQSQSSSGLKPYSTYGGYELRDGSKNPSMTFEQRDAQFAKSMAEGAYVAPAIGLGAVALSAPVALPVAAYGRLAFASLSARALTTAGAVNTGIGLGINASFQLASGKEFSYVDLTVAGATSFATTNLSLLPSIYINTLGAYGGSLVQLQNPIPSMTGAGGGTLAGTGVSSTLDFISNSKVFGKYSQPVQQAIKFTKPLASSLAQEKVGNTVKGALEK